MVAYAKTLYVSPVEYLRREREAEVKSEYWDRVIVVWLLRAIISLVQSFSSC
jgi:hypothetical protein